MASERLKANVPLVVKAVPVGSEPVVPPLPICRVPSRTDAAPLMVFVPVSTRVPVPSLPQAAVPEITPEMPAVFPRELIVLLAVPMTTLLESVNAPLSRTLPPVVKTVLALLWTSSVAVPRAFALSRITAPRLTRTLPVSVFTPESW